MLKKHVLHALLAKSEGKSFGNSLSLGSPTGKKLACLDQEHTINQCTAHGNGDFDRRTLEPIVKCWRAQRLLRL